MRLQDMTDEQLLFQALAEKMAEVEGRGIAYARDGIIQFEVPTAGVKEVVASEIPVIDQLRWISNNLDEVREAQALNAKRRNLLEF